VTELARRIKEDTNKDIWCYTGFTYEEILGNDYLKQILPYIDVLVDGQFIEELRDESLPFRGSRNQNIIELNKINK
jgi:anaerobic ribonucleoside-triphosphate reductase activating protein